MLSSDPSDEDDSTFGISEDLVQSPTHKAASATTVDFDGLLQPALKLNEDLSEGCGGQVWPAGMVLAKYLLRTKQDDLRRCGSIVELGAGVGLVGLAVALGCRPSSMVQTVHVTDQEPMLPLMQTNIGLNNLQGKVKASVYDWGSERPANVPAFPDFVLAADCVYFEPAFPLLQYTLQELIGPKTVCYFCFKKRRRADLHFMKTAKKLFDVTEVLDDPDHEVRLRENLFVYTLRRKCQG